MVHMVVLHQTAVDAREKQSILTTNSGNTAEIKHFVATIDDSPEIAAVVGHDAVHIRAARTIAMNFAVKNLDVIERPALAILHDLGEQSGLWESAQGDKWSFCL